MSGNPKTLSRFKEIARRTKGMLNDIVYHTYYDLSRNPACGSVTEIGTGQGASTIAFALGIKESGRPSKVYAIDQFFQVWPGGPHPYSLSEFPDVAVRRNLARYRKNLDRFDVSEQVELLLGKSDEVELNLPAGEECGILAIDADGMIDRDLNLFLGQVAVGGIVIIDDYKDAINSEGRMIIEELSPLGRDGLLLRLQEETAYFRRRLLGKHLLTFRLARYFVDEGYLDEVGIIGTTFFARKTFKAQEAFKVDSVKITAIEKSIVDEFLDVAAGQL